jgi:hypothetical protein
MMWESLAGLQEALQRYRTVQTTHEQSLDTATAREVERLAFERANAFAELHNALTAAAQYLQAQAHTTLPQEYHQQLVEILALEERLAAHLQEQRDLVGRRLGRLRQSKQAFIGYGGLPSLAPPTYIKTSV